MTTMLNHYGVRGMKWGRRKKTPNTGPSRSQKIHAARSRQAGRQLAYDSLNARRALMVSKKGQQTIARKMDHLKNTMLDGPDFKESNKLTTGESVAVGLLAGGLAALFVGSIVAPTKR